MLASSIIFMIQSPAISQDEGIPDTVFVYGDSLYTGRSVPIHIGVVNDFPMRAISFGLVSISVDSGFARLDSIVWTGRLLDSSSLSLRISGPREDNGISPDSTFVSAYRAGSETLPLLPGSGSICELWMTGIIPGVMVVDSGFMPPGGTFMMVPFNGDFTGDPFTPQYVNSPINIIEGIGIKCGNIDKSSDGSVDIADLTALIDYLFITFAVPAGLAAANVDGSEDGRVDIADLTRLIDHLFINFPELNCL